MEKKLMEYDIIDTYPSDEDCEYTGEGICGACGADTYVGVLRSNRIRCKGCAKKGDFNHLDGCVYCYSRVRTNLINMINEYQSEQYHKLISKIFKKYNINEPGLMDKVFENLKIKRI